MAKSPVKGKYDTTIDSESAYEVLQKRVAGTAAPAGTTAGGGSSADAAAGGGVLTQLTNIVGTIFGTNRPRGQRLSTGQVIARDLTRSVANKVVGGMAASLGKSVGGSLGSSIGRSIVRGTLGGVLRR
jgi:hypothetical protein